MWKLETQTDLQRTYRNSLTGTECKTMVIHTDMYGGKWWAFADLFTVPLIREIAAKKVVELSSASLTQQDLQEHIAKSKAILKSDDREKYEKAYGELLEFERICNAVADPVKQTLGLATVYILADDERPDTFDQGIAHRKMDIWHTDLNAMGFFLNWLTDTISSFVSASSSIGQIASALQQSGSRKPIA